MDEKQKYIDLHAELHNTNTYKSHPEGLYFPGISIRYQLEHIARLVRETKAKTLLDYGCGQGRQYESPKYKDKPSFFPASNVHEKWGIMPTLFDPAVPRFAEKPEGKFDGVVCTDVMEHIPESATMEVLAEIYDYANKFVLLAIALDWSDTLLPNGDSVHINPKPIEWWQPKLKQVKQYHPDLIVEVYFGSATGFEGGPIG